MMKKSVVIVAGGSGKRMKSDIPKQFLLLNGIPVLMHTINTFYTYDSTIEIVLVLPADQINIWVDLCDEHYFDLTHQIVEGGNSRFQSVKNGLETISNDHLVGIHDGVRPLVSLNTIDRCYATAGEKGNAIPVVDVFESIREVTHERNKIANRDQFKMVQTPQVFMASQLKEAYNCKFKNEFTDDASVMEYAGHKIILTEGNRENIKITTPIDIVIGEALLSSGKEI